MKGVLEALKLPARWRFEPFRNVAARRKEIGQADLEPLSVYLDQGVVPRSSRDDNYNVLGADLSKYLVVYPGDLVFNKLRTWQGGLGVSRYSGIVSPAYFVCSPNSALAESRYLHYLLRSGIYLTELTRISKWMPPSQFDIGWEDLRLLPVLLPPLEVQKQIATFLDLETVRFDVLVHLKEQLRKALVSRWEIEVRDALGGTKSGVEWPVAPLKRHWTVIDCSHRTPTYVPQGYPIVSPGDIDEAGIQLGRTNRFVDADDFADLTRGRRPRRGDLIYTRNAAIGKAGYVDTDTPFAMGQDVCLITSANEDQRFLAYVLNTAVKDQLASMKLGATFDRINVSQILELAIPSPAPEVQSHVADRLDQRRAAYQEIDRLLVLQIERLAEHRQALITAAVTGESDLAHATA